MTPEESKKLDKLCEKVDQIHDVLYEKGLVHEVRDLSDWRDSVNKMLTRVLFMVIALLMSTAAGAVIFYLKNSN